MDLSSLLSAARCSVVAVFVQAVGRKLDEMMGSVEYLHLREIAEVDFG